MAKYEVVPYSGRYPIADDPWSFTSKDEDALLGGKDGNNWRRYKSAFLIADAGSPKKRTAYHFPHHKMKGGKMYTFRRGVFAAGSRLTQQTKKYAEVIDGARNHLAKHYKQLGATAPWKRSALHVVRWVDDEGNTLREDFSVATAEDCAASLARLNDLNLPEEIATQIEARIMQHYALLDMEMYDELLTYQKVESDEDLKFDLLDSPVVLKASDSALSELIQAAEEDTPKQEGETEAEQEEEVIDKVDEDETEQVVGMNQTQTEEPGVQEQPELAETIAQAVASALQPLVTLLTEAASKEADTEEPAEAITEAEEEPQNDTASDTDDTATEPKAAGEEDTEEAEAEPADNGEEEVDPAIELAAQIKRDLIETAVRLGTLLQGDDSEAAREVLQENYLTWDIVQLTAEVAKLTAQLDNVALGVTDLSDEVEVETTNSDTDETETQDDDEPPLDVDLFARLMSGK